MSSIDDGTTIHGSLVPNKSLSQACDKDGRNATPDWRVAAYQPTIYLTLVNGNTPVAPSGWSASSQDAVTWKWNGNTITFDPATGLSTGAAVIDTNRLFQRTTMTWNSTTVPALKIIYNLARVGNLDNDIISIEGNVEMSGEPIGFTAGVNVRLGELNANGYHGGIDFLNDKSYISSDDDSVTAIGRLYHGMDDLSAQGAYKCAWKFNGNDVTATTGSVHIATTDHANDTLVVTGNDESGVLDIATITCMFYVPNKEDDTKLDHVYTVIETVDDTGDEEYLWTFFTIAGTTARTDGSPVSLHKNQKVTWDMWVAKADNKDDIQDFTKYEFQPYKADGATMAASDFTTESGAPLTTAGKWSNGWCDITALVSGHNHGQFTCCYADIHAAGKNISGIVRAT